MSQDENPYSSPRTQQAPREGDEKPRVRQFASIFLTTDAVLSLLSVVSTTMFLVIMQDPALSSSPVLASSYLPPGLALLAYPFLKLEIKKGLVLAYTAGVAGASTFPLALLYVAWHGAAIAGIVVFVGILRTLWHVTYIFAARSFARSRANNSGPM